MVVAAASRTSEEISTRIRSRRSASRFDSGSSHRMSPGFRDEGPGERHPLLLAPGQLVRVPLGQLAEAHPIEHGGRPGAGIGLGKLAAAQRERHG